jgi:Bacterial signalling protein N terminal repeat
LTIYNCITNAHDLRLVGLAAVICMLASFSAISLLHHMRPSTGHLRHMWLVVSAISTGFGIWATHFIAMLAFTPGVPSAYNIALTFLSLVAAIFLTGAGLAAAVMSSAAAGAYLGGAMVGGGIAAMHYTGMAAFEIQGRTICLPTRIDGDLSSGDRLPRLYPAFDARLRPPSALVSHLAERPSCCARCCRSDVDRSDAVGQVARSDCRGEPRGWGREGQERPALPRASKCAFVNPIPANRKHRHAPGVRETRRFGASKLK